MARVTSQPRSARFYPPHGLLAIQAGDTINLDVHKSAARYCLGTVRFDPEIGCEVPFTGESNEFWPTYEDANRPLLRGEWTQKCSL